MNNVPKTTELMGHHNLGPFPAQRFPVDPTSVGWGVNPRDTTAKKLLLIFYTWRDSGCTRGNAFSVQTTKEVTLLTR